MACFLACQVYIVSRVLFLVWQVLAFLFRVLPLLVHHGPSPCSASSLYSGCRAKNRFDQWLVRFK